ncbi:two-pore potassium channel 1-like [Olea europaea subsp. europaea]|uniref:Two-pore potassium channel 1-like n=1 Tax=Olea europaea subsp. europaea TaxID=158383 RepID=A0A8S0RRL5_OLEEU|nr:two-pore potassium channel 1-like [Olea europaea subsp. europaea]
MEETLLGGDNFIVAPLERTNGILDSVSFCIVTITTVGYEDLVPSSVSTKLLSCVFAISGVALVGVIVSKAVDHLIEKQQKMLIDALDMRELGRTKTPGAIESDNVRTKRTIDSVQYRSFVTRVLLVVLVIIGTAFLGLLRN